MWQTTPLIFAKQKLTKGQKTNRNRRILSMAEVAMGAGMSYPMAHTITFDTNAGVIGVDIGCTTCIYDVTTDFVW